MTTRTPPDVLLELATANIAARALHVIADLGIADGLDVSARTIDELAGDAGVDADALGRLLRLLEERGVFRRDGAGRWTHTDVSRFLRSDHPASLRAFARMAGTPFCWDALTHLPHAVRTGEPGIIQLHPDGWIAHLDAHPDERAIFQAAMTAKAHDDIAASLAVHDFSRYGRICDVAGGHGHLLRAVLDAHPGITGVLFELAPVAAEATSADRLDVVAGDFFTDPLPQADGYVLMNILHDWDDKAAVDILTAVADAGRAQGATVLILETVMPDGPRPHWSKTLDVLMLAVTGGRERTLAEYSDLVDAAGLQLAGVTPTATPFSIVEAHVR